MSWASYQIISDWGQESLQATQIAEKALATFQRLHAVSDVMRNWIIQDGADYQFAPLTEVAGRLAAVVAESVTWKDANGPDDPANGYEVFGVGWRQPSDVMTPDSVVVSATAGGVYNNGLWLEIGSNRHATDFTAVTYETYLGALEVLASEWPCPWAVANAYTPEAAETPVDAPGFTGRLQAPFAAPWIAYLSAPLAAGLQAPPEIKTAPTPGRGVVLSAVEGMIDLENPQHLRQAGMLYGILLNHVGIQPGFPSPVKHAARTGPY